jgi:molybdopterin synthase catalytic subunit
VTYFAITRSAIIPEQHRSRATLAETGNVVSFDGRVRNHHRGRTVIALEYTIYEDLARTEGEAILEEASERYDVCSIWAVHRCGPVPIGESAVWIEVESAHREDGFLACRFVIDEVKRRLPIWKHETYEDGTSEWIQPPA